MIEVKFPGKLFILGEYSIMEPGSSALITSVNRYLKGSIEQSETLIIQSDYGTLTQDTYDEKMDYVKSGLDVAQDYLNIKNIKLKPFKLILTSELNNEKNQKYGFGSSGVVILTVIDAILKFHEIEVSKEMLFKLAVVAQKRMSNLSSGGDLAASIYGGLILYTRYSLDDISEDVTCVLRPWKHLKIVRLPNPYRIEVAYTGQSHDTNLALAAFKKFKENDKEHYNALIHKANDIVLNSVNDLLKGITKYREWMLTLAKILNYEIETPALTNLIESANKLGYVAKVSGSGGGDCGFAISETLDQQKELIQVWEKLGLEYIEGAVQ